MRKRYKLAKGSFDSSYLTSMLLNEERNTMSKNTSNQVLNKDNPAKCSQLTENTPPSKQAKDIPLTDSAAPLSFNQPPPVQPAIKDTLYCVVVLVMISFAYTQADRTLMYIIYITVTALIAPQALKYIIPFIKEGFPPKFPESK